MIEIFSESIYNVAAFLLLISVIVFVHEYGHYYIARLAGVKIEVFSIGFGKELFGWVDKHNTRWKICLLPMGGYVKMFGDKGEASTPDHEKLKQLSPEEKKYAFHAKSLPWRMAIVSAGPIANYILAILIMTFFFSFYGMPSSEPVIDQVEVNGPAARAGLIPGDRIVQIDETKINKFMDIQKIIAFNKGEGLVVHYMRGTARHETTIIPDIAEKEDIFGNVSKRSKLGVASSNIVIQKQSIPQSLVSASKEAYDISAATLQAFAQILTGKRSADELGGPIRIAQYSGQSVKKGFNVVLWFMAVLSLNLGLINLMPVPMLDGGHLFFYIIEAIKGSPVPEKIQQIGFQIGLFLLVILFAFSTYNDIKNLNIF